MFLGQFRMCSHQLQIETDHHLAHQLWVCRLCSPKSEIEDHFIFRCSVYYEIQGWYQCLFWDSHNSILTFFQFLNQHCVALYLREAFLLRKRLLFDTQHSTNDHLITSFFQASSKEGACRRRRDDPLLPTQCTRQWMCADTIPLRSQWIKSFFSSNNANAAIVTTSQREFHRV